MVIELKHENVVSLIEVVVDKSLNFYLVFEHAQNDLSVILDNTTNPFTESEIKCLMQQLLKVYLFCFSLFCLNPFNFYILIFNSFFVSNSFFFVELFECYFN